MKKIETSKKTTKPHLRPALSPEEREKQLIALAYDRAEEHLINGTATSQEICYFLKRGSEKEKMEQEILKGQAKLITAKTEAIESSSRSEETYIQAIAAMKEYSGESESNEPENI